MNQAQLLLGGRLDFTIAGNSFLALNFAKEGLPFVAVAAVFQKDPSVIIAHPGVGNDSFVAIKGKPVMIGADTRIGWWAFMRQRYGYTDDQIRPYCVQPGAVPGGQDRDPAGVFGVRAVFGEAAGRV